MAEEFENETLASGTGSGDAMAAQMAMSGPHSPVSEEYLRKHSRLLDLQIENLRKLDEYEVSHLRWRRFNDQMKGALQILLALVGVAIVFVIGAAAWNASQAEGLVVDTFSVPPQFAQNGIGGDVVADDLTRKVAAVRDRANAHSIAHSKDVKNERDEEIKVEIPDTGISLAEVSRYLRSWLGHERHLSGNLRQTGDGKIALTVALNGADALTFTGPPGDLDKLEQQAAEHVFQGVDPSNYILYLYSLNRRPEALDAIRHLVSVADSPGMLSDGYSLWGNWDRSFVGDLAASEAHSRTAASIDPKELPPQMEMSFVANDLGHDEEELRLVRSFPTYRQDEQFAWKEGEGFADVVNSGAITGDALTGDFSRAISQPCLLCSFTEALIDHAEYAARQHDIVYSDAEIKEALSTGDASASDIARARYFADIERADWRAAVTDAWTYATLQTRAPRLTAILVRTHALPLLAVALAHTGDFAAAHDEIDKTPGDCVGCETARGDIDALQGNYRGAEYWFARAVHDAPSIPFAYSNWGAMRMKRGDLDGAIEKFTLANQKGPHFADSMEMWGEALIRENRSDLALAKFSEANKYAPNWGRLHLKWGEALLWSGKPNEAKTQFMLAATLALSPSDKSQLAIARTMHG